MLPCPAVLRFARATGDLHSLSTADIRLIALAHTLEVARHGDAALKQLPDLPSVRKGNAPAAKELPGWNVSGGKWADMDALMEEEMAEQELAGEVYICTSRESCLLSIFCFAKSNMQVLLVSSVSVRSCVELWHEMSKSTDQLGSNEQVSFATLPKLKLALDL